MMTAETDKGGERRAVEFIPSPSRYLLAFLQHRVHSDGPHTAVVFDLADRKSAPGWHARVSIPSTNQFFIKKIRMSVKRIGMPLKGMFGTKESHSGGIHCHR